MRKLKDTSIREVMNGFRICNDCKAVLHDEEATDEFCKYCGAVNKRYFKRG